MLERRIRIFRNGRNQAIRIPRDLELSGDEAILRMGLCLVTAKEREFRRIRGLRVDNWLAGSS